RADGRRTEVRRARDGGARTPQRSPRRGEQRRDHRAGRRRRFRVRVIRRWVRCWCRARPRLGRRRRSVDVRLLLRLPRRSARARPERTLAKFDALEDVKETLRRQLAAVVLAAHDSFLKVRRAALSGGPSSGVEAPKVARKAPCPCGSGKKYKRCCGDRA